MKYSILIPFHRNKNLLYQCLNSILSTTPDSVSILVLCNNEDRNEIDINSKSGRVTIKKFNRTIPYPQIINIGAKAVSSDGLFFIDSDTVCIGNWFYEMTRVFESNENIGIVGANILNTMDGTISDLGLNFDGYSWIHPHKKRHIDFELVRTREFQCLCSACCLVKRDMFLQMGGFEERLPYTYCDIDYCLRLQDINKKVIGCAEAKVYHFGGSHFNNNVGLRNDSRGKLILMNASRISNATDCFFEENYSFFQKKYDICPNYIFVDISTVSDTKFYTTKIKELLKTNIIGEYSFRQTQRDMGNLNLSLIIPADLYISSVPIIFLTDVYSSLTDNALWMALRANENDIVIDRHTNIELLSKLLKNRK